MKKLGKYSFGVGDRFMQEGNYQMSAFVEAREMGIDVTPVWNKSKREHDTVGTTPQSVREEADKAVSVASWPHSYFVDADHISYDTLDAFLPYSDFFTIDVADQINQQLSEEELLEFIQSNDSYLGELNIDGIGNPYLITKEFLEELAAKYYLAMKEAARIYQKIGQKKKEDFTIEVSIDEVDQPQSPLELFFILKMLSDLHVPIQTIAPKFTGRFNKGIDYEGDTAVFEREFEECLLVVQHSIDIFDLPKELKLSVHTGSDKFSLYPIINRLLKKHDVGLHLKTAGTTWLEEAIGLAEAGGEALEMIKEVYRSALDRYDELTRPYATVLNIDQSQLPSSEQVTDWSCEKLVNSLNHDQQHPDFNPGLRQLFHTAYKIAAERKGKVIKLIQNNKDLVGQRVKQNILERHIRPLYQ